jgi:hypothetical protein
MGLLMGSGVGWLANQVATNEGLGRVGPTLHFTLVADFFDLVTVTGAFGVVDPPDYGGFSQEVIDQYGVVSTATSSRNIYIYDLTAGLRTPFFAFAQWPARGFWVMFGYVRAGESWISGGRQIANCSDCNGMDFNMRGGPVLDAGIDFGFKAANLFGVSIFSAYRQYFGDSSLLREIRAGLGFWFLSAPGAQRPGPPSAFTPHS